MRDERTIEERFWAKVEKGESCWPWTGPKDWDGYGLSNFASKQGLSRAHRLAWTIHNGPIPTGLHVLHHCDNPPCVRPDHLFVGTNADNKRDSVAKMRHNIGSRHARAILCEADIPIIRSRNAAGEGYGRLARVYHVHKNTIRYAVLGKSWKHIP